MKKNTAGEFQYRFGRMIKGINSLLLKDDQISDSQNMQPGYYGWKQRKGSEELTTSAIASGLRFKSLIHHRDFKGNTDAIIAHVYDASNGERVMKQTTLPTSTHAGNTWSEMYDLTASCENAQFALVNGALLAANDKEFLVWKGEQYLPSGVWKFEDTSDYYMDYFDEVTDNNSSTSMGLNSMTIGDYVYLTAPMPLDEIIVDVGDTNSTAAWMLFEYYNSTGVWTLLKAASWWSNTTYLDDDCDDISGWTDEDNNGGASTQEEYKSRECFKLDSGGSTGANTRAQRVKDVGTFADDVSVSVLCYHSALGTLANIDYFDLRIAESGVECQIFFATDGLYVYDGASSNEVGTNIVDTGEWILWTFVCDFSTPASATVDVYKNGSLVQADVDCSNTGSFTDGQILICQRGEANTNRITYVAQIVVGDAIDTTGDAFSDGTSSSSTTLAQDGSITWTSPEDDGKTLIDGVPGFAYRFSPNKTIDASVTILDIDVHSPMGEVRALWSGEYMTPTGCYLYDGTDHTDYTLYVGNTVQSQYMDLSGVTTTDKIYVGFPFRTNRIIFHPTSDGANTSDVSVTAVKYCNYAGTWTSVGTVTDTTETNDATLSQKGYYSWVDPGSTLEKMSKIAGDTVPWYWYEITVDAALDAATYIYYIEAIPIDDDPDYCFGCFGWKRRAWQIAPLNMENQVRYSAENLIDIWGGADSGRIEFGERPLRCAAPFYNEVVLFADTEMWMLQGNKPTNFGRLRLSANIGCAAPGSVVSVETGVQVGDSMKNVVVWQFYDGFWMFDGVRVMKISSPDIDSFFDPSHEDYINPTYLDETQGEYDYETQCVMWSVYSGSSATTPTKTIVLHFPTMWYGIFDYEVDMGPMCRVFNNKYYTVGGGHSTGKVYLLNTGVTDDNSSGTAVAVDAYIVTRDMFLSYSDGLQQRLLSVWAEAQDDGGLVEIDEYPDGSDTPQNIAKGSMSWVGKLFGIIQKPLKSWSSQKTAKFRIRNRSKNARMNLLGFSTTADKGRADE